jgi:hypothetical protein
MLMQLLNQSAKSPRTDRDACRRPPSVSVLPRSPGLLGERSQSGGAQAAISGGAAGVGGCYVGLCSASDFRRGGRGGGGGSCARAMYL